MFVELSPQTVLYRTVNILGALNISACQGGAPVFVSLPHFLYGDYYRGLVEGMKPSQEAHDTYIDVEKVSSSYAVSKSVQYTMHALCCLW